jgi:hypothetical protein
MIRFSNRYKIEIEYRWSTTSRGTVEKLDTNGVLPVTKIPCFFLEGVLCQ